jgi:hypothetical protein
MIDFSVDTVPQQRDQSLAVYTDQERFIRVRAQAAAHFVGPLHLRHLLGICQGYYEPLSR